MIKLSCKIKHNFNNPKPFATRINLNTDEIKCIEDIKNHVNNINNLI